METSGRVCTEKQSVLCGILLVEDSKDLLRSCDRLN
jgi:hypothetical protein